MLVNCELDYGVIYSFCNLQKGTWRTVYFFFFFNYILSSILYELEWRMEEVGRKRFFFFFFAKYKKITLW